MKPGLFISSSILLLIVFAVLAPVAPLYQPVPDRDQGVYLYAGQQVLDGKIPYRDVWDHKGPLIYYINALGLWMFGSTWGVWVVEVIFLFLTALACLLALQMVFDPFTALVSTVLWLSAFSKIIDHGNSVEEYSLLFQFSAIYFYLRSLSTEKYTWNEFMIGVTAALAFSLRPNNIGVHLAIGLVLLIPLFFAKERKPALVKLVAMAAGGACVLIAIAFYFAVHGALGALIDQVFIFNYYYSRLGEFSWLALGKGIELLKPLVLTALAGFAGALLLRPWKQGRLLKSYFFFILAALPIQLFLSLLSGRRYMHYYIAWLPVLALLVGFLIYFVQKLADRFLPNFTYLRTLSLLIVLGLVLGLGLQPVIGRLAILGNLSRSIWVQKSFPPPDVSKVDEGIYVDYLLKNTQPGDYVLIWGNASVYNFLSDRASPSRFVYTYAFGVPPYVSQEMVDELQQDIAEKRPLILDATAGDATINRLSSKMWSDLPITQGLIRFIEENYIRVEKVGDFQVWIFKAN